MVFFFVSCLETTKDAQVRGERDGDHVHRRAQVVHQPAHGQPGESACDQGQYREQVLAAETQTLQQVSDWEREG